MYGYSRLVFYVVRNDPMSQRLWFNTPRWLTSAVESQSYAEMRQDDLNILRQYGEAERFENHPVYLGRTKKRWWWRFIPFRQLICPFKPFKIVH